MNLKAKILGLGILFTLGFFIVATADSKPAVKPAVKKAATVAAAATKVATTKAGATVEKPLEGTVVVKSSSDQEDDPYANENKNDSGPAAPSFKLAKDDKTDLLTIDAPGEDIRSIVSKVADLYSLNIVIPSALNGTTTLKLRDVSWRQLFNVMLPPTGFSYVEDKNIILIKSREEVSAEPTETRVFLINYGNATELQASITPLIDASNGGKVQVDKRSNALVVTERPSKFNNIKDIIDRLDHATPQVLIESKFIDLDDTQVKNLGLDWSSLSSYKLSAGSLSRTWAHDHGGTTPGTTMVDGAVFSAPEFDLIIHALNTLNGSDLISNPTIVTLNNTEATINVGEEYPIPDYSYNQQQGVFEVSGFEYKPIGVILKVTPQVNSQGFITLNVAPEVSSSDKTVTFGTTNSAQIPIIQTRKTSSTVTIKDGYTLAIGGLIQTAITPTSSGLPFLGSIPVLGNTIFGGSTNTTEKRNLMIFITARTVSPDGTDGATINQRQMLDMNLSASDLPGYQPAVDEQKLQKALSERLEAVKHAQSQAALRKQVSTSTAAVREASEPSDKIPSRAH